MRICGKFVLLNAAKPEKMALSYDLWQNLKKEKKTFKLLYVLWHFQPIPLLKFLVRKFRLGKRTVSFGINQLSVAVWSLGLLTDWCIMGIHTFSDQIILEKSQISAQLRWDWAIGCRELWNCIIGSEVVLRIVNYLDILKAGNLFKGGVL